MKIMTYVSAVAVLGATGVGGLLAAEPEAAAEKGRTTHSLFMGTDVSVEVDKVFHRVREVSRSSWVITRDGRPEFIPTERRQLNLRVGKSLKLADTSATLANLKSERAYTSGNNPLMKAVQSQGRSSSYMTDLAMIENMRMGNAALQNQIAAMNAGKSGGEPSDDQKDAFNDAQETYGRSVNYVSGGQAVLRETHLGVADAAAAEENFDAIEISFELSAARPLKNPYLVAVALISDREATEGMKRNWIYAQELGQVDETPRTIRIHEGGLPFGYELENVEVHIYEQGREVATNVSPKRVDLTREEAFQYLVIEHIGNNKGKTVPALPVMAAVGPELKARLGAGEGQQVYYVNVSKEGLVTEVFEDEDHARPVSDSFFAEEVKRVWFKPALEKGQPVESKATLDVTKLAW